MEVHLLANSKMENVVKMVKNLKEGKVCASCQGVSGKLLTCSVCEVTHYCNRECQKKDWKRHKTECCPNLDVKLEKQKLEDEKEKQESEEYLDTECVESWKQEYKKNVGKTFLMQFYESTWRSRGELYLLERARKEVKAELAAKGK